MTRTSTARIRVAQAGCGYWGPNILRNLAQNPKCAVVAIADSQPERRAWATQLYPDAAIRADWRDLIDDPDIDALVIATPAASHFTIAKAAIQAGKHLLVEKPLATSVAEVDELIRLTDRHGTILMVGHTFIYNDAVRQLRAMVQNGDLGDIVYMYAQRLNLGQLRSDVNAWWNLAPHDVSIQLYLAGGGPVRSVTATGRAYLQPGVEDIVMANLVWSDGPMGAIQVSWLDPQKLRQLTVVGSKKMVVYDDISENKLTVFEKGFERVPRIGDRMDFDDHLSPVSYKQRQGAITIPYFKMREPLSVEIDHFLDCIRLDRQPDTDGRHAREVVAILEAGQTSLRNGGTATMLLEKATA